MMTDKNKGKTKIVTNNGIKYVKKKRKLPFIMFTFFVIISLTMFFGYSQFIMAQDDWDFGDDFFDENGEEPTEQSGDSSEAGNQTTDIGDRDPDDFDLSEAELSQFEVASKVRVKYFNDDPSDDDSHKDPFKPLIVRKAPERPEPTRPRDQEPEVERIPPLDITLVGVIQAGSRTMAMLEYEGKYMEMFEGDEISDFRVRSIDSNSIQVLSFLHQGEIKTYELGR
ncbi:MAG: hypothetical protein ACQESP_00925 [Candidatus Muiribacteriota bacterium]